MMKFKIQNEMTLELVQEHFDGSVKVIKRNADGSVDAERTIPASQFVSLCNLYSYVMDYDIRNDFLNPYGEYKEL